MKYLLNSANGCNLNKTLETLIPEIVYRACHGTKQALSKEEFLALKNLASNDNIIITKPDKGNGVVILNKTSYVEKMMNILNDRTKFAPILDDLFRTGKFEEEERDGDGCLLPLLRKVPPVVQTPAILQLSASRFLLAGWHYWLEGLLVGKEEPGPQCIYTKREVPKEARAEETYRCGAVDPWPGPLYSLSWWKDGSQFYRASVAYSIGNPATVFALPGIKVKAGLGGLGHVVLQRVGVAATGPTSACYPPYLGRVQDPLLPRRGVGVNCTVLRAHRHLSSPATTGGGWVQEVLEVTQEADLTRTTTARLTLRLKRHHFTNNEVNLTCGARVGHNLWITNSITTQRARPRQYHHHLKKVKGGAGVTRPPILNRVFK
ncbi:hypothetical protein Hamer_G014750 [Homarus americanus]|uniref:Uncharacterized protein n=1 Tax=Homarus americanus TaxID=6706 RepID=A0A8J5N1T4_HOMAM|nr:hypothetical protein Hamer_G014750 [Homarus americanus]